MMGMGQKKPKTKKTKRRKNTPFGFPPIPRLLFSGVRKKRKQAGPTLGGTRVLV